MQHNPTKKARPSFSLSNLQVTLLLLIAGVCLISATWVFAVDIGRVPVSLWDICTTALSSTPTEAVPSSTSAPTK
ncbi:hypothetical protein PQR63_20575 [Herbaspirillum rhizosphaerae]|uniref:Uncharacterized protein n=1 Tax=Herbaspirillum rhizosphaerae TaxID=346179 RepID=A0ABW8ZE46_9BURK